MGYYGSKDDDDEDGSDRLKAPHEMMDGMSGPSDMMDTLRAPMDKMSGGGDDSDTLYSHGSGGGESLSYADISNGMTVEIRWSSMSGKGGRATGEVTRTDRGGTENPNGLNMMVVSVGDGVRYRVYPDAGYYDGGVSRPDVERVRGGSVQSIGTLTDIKQA